MSGCYAVRVLADSVNPAEVRLTTLEIRAPRVPCWEHVLTHRALSRNASSHRAVPTGVMVERATVRPAEWGAKQKGMVAKRALQERAATHAAEVWEEARQFAVTVAQLLDLVGVHKQVANRVLRPFESIEAVISATDWRNFLTLRTGADVEPETRRLAELIRDALTESSPTFLPAGAWHLPYVTDAERETIERTWTREAGADLLARVSAARCARVSTLHHGTPRDLAGDGDWTMRVLVGTRHWSPLEHPAQALATAERVGNYRGFRQLRKRYQGESGEDDA